MLTNSPFTFTNTVMKHILDDKWQEYFDTVVVKACKPAFFQQGTPLRYQARGIYVQFSAELPKIIRSKS